MVVVLLEYLLALLLIPAFILHILHFEWFKKYVSIVSRSLFSVLQIFVGVMFGVVLVIPKLVVGSLKAVLIAILSVVLAAIYLVTFVVPYVGGKGNVWRESLTNGVVASYLAVQVRTMRDMMVRIVAEEDERHLSFDEPERYRTELDRVKQDATNRLESGETRLSILLGAILIAAQLAGVKVLQASIYGIPMDVVIEGWLLVIAVSIIYRSSVLEFLAYSPDDDFESLDKMDAALGYQKVVSLVGFVQGLMFLLVLMAAVSKVKYSIIEDALRAMYTDEPWVSFTWERLTNSSNER